MPGRPRSFDRDAALDSAVDCFWRNGYEDTTVAGLTAAMGINPPSLYAAFGDKDALFTEAVGCYGERLTRAIQRSLDAPTAREGIAVLFASAAVHHTDPATPAGCFVLSEPRLSHERADLRRLVAERIRRGIAEGDVPATADAEALAGLVVAVLSGMSARARDGASVAEVSAIGAAAVAAIPAS